MRLAPSPAAQFQAMKTRAVLGAQLIWQALIFLLALWIVLTTFIIWHALTRAFCYRASVGCLT
jgi:hypothetical protein